MTVATVTAGKSESSKSKSQPESESDSTKTTTGKISLPSAKEGEKSTTNGTDVDSEVKNKPNDGSKSDQLSIVTDSESKPNTADFLEPKDDITKSQPESDKNGLKTEAKESDDTKNKNTSKETYQTNSGKIKSEKLVDSGSNSRPTKPPKPQTVPPPNNQHDASYFSYLFPSQNCIQCNQNQNCGPQNQILKVPTIADDLRAAEAKGTLSNYQPHSTNDGKLPPTVIGYLWNTIVMRHIRLILCVICLYCIVYHTMCCEVLCNSRCFGRLRGSPGSGRRNTNRNRSRNTNNSRDNNEEETVTLDSPGNNRNGSGSRTETTDTDEDNDDDDDDQGTQEDVKLLNKNDDPDEIV